MYRQSDTFIPSWTAVILDIAILYVAITNLDYNRRGALASERIAHELGTINKSKFMNRLNGELEKENKYGKKMPKTD